MEALFYLRTVTLAINMISAWYFCSLKKDLCRGILSCTCALIVAMT